MIGAQSLAWWSVKLHGTDCCVTPVLTLAETLVNEQFMARGMVLPGTTSNSNGQPFVQLACPVKMSGFEFVVRHPAPAQGQHTSDILREAGYSDAEADALRRQGAVA